MDAREFQVHTREILEHTLNQLQAATLLVAQLESQVSEAGRSVQGLTQVIEQYVNAEIISTTDLPPPTSEEEMAHPGGENHSNQ
jgi:hypothetical protein